MTDLKKIIVLILIICSNILSAQEANNEFKNSVYFDYFYCYKYIKTNTSYSSHNSIFMLNYYRTIVNQKIFKVKLEAGLGIYKESPGEYEGLFASMNTKFSTKCFVGSKRHQGFSGLSIDFIPYYLDTYLILPIGYKFNISPRFSTNVSFNQHLLFVHKRYNEETNKSEYTSEWIWNSKSNTFRINIGFGFNF